MRKQVAAIWNGDSRCSCPIDIVAISVTKAMDYAINLKAYGVSIYSKYGSEICIAGDNNITRIHGVTISPVYKMIVGNSSG